MTGFLRMSLLFVAPVLGVGALGFHERDLLVSTVAGSGPPVQRELVDQPPYWVPFSAELKRIHESDGSVFVGRQLRSSDGSTRNDTGRSFEDINSIAIKNVAQETFYRWTPIQGWTSQPMTLPHSGWTPMPTRFNKQMTKVNDTLEGLALIKFESAGRVFYQAPQLNLFTLVTLVKCKYDSAATCGTWYSNIKVGEQPADQFLAPSGVQIVVLKEPGGIVKHEQLAQ